MYGAKNKIRKTIGHLIAAQRDTPTFLIYTEKADLRHVMCGNCDIHGYSTIITHRAT